MSDITDAWAAVKADLDIRNSMAGGDDGEMSLGQGALDRMDEVVADLPSGFGTKVVPLKLNEAMRFAMSEQIPAHFGNLDKAYEAALAAAPPA
jgi:hypothetical protein